MSNKKVHFYSLIKHSYAVPGAIEPATDIRNLIDYIVGRPFFERQYDLHAARFCRLEAVETNNRVSNLMFKSASNKYRAPLMDRASGVERDNPKTLSEGERVKTHLGLKFNDDIVYVCLESGFGTLKIQQVVNYFNRFASDYHAHIGTVRDYRYDFEIIAKHNFLDELASLNRVMEGELFVDKTILGSDALNYSERTETVKHNLKLVLKAERGFSITNAITDAFNKLNGGHSTINKIRVKGKNENDNEVIIDTELIAKTEFVEIETHQETGEVNSDIIFEQLRNILLPL